MFKNKLRSKIIRWLGLSLLSAFLIISVFFIHHYNLVFSKVSAQSVVKEYQSEKVSESYLKIAQETQSQEIPDQSNSSEDKKEKKLDIFPMIVGMLGGLSLFLYGMEQLSAGLRALAGDKMKQFLSRFTTNRYAGVATGTIVTGILDSSIEPLRRLKCGGIWLEIRINFSP